MWQAMMNWLRSHSRLTLGLPPPPPYLPPENLEAFYLATLSIIYDNSRHSQGSINQIREAMTERLAAGEWHPDATRKDDPVKYAKNLEKQQWEAMVVNHEKWFDGAAWQLFEIIREYVNDHTSEGEHEERLRKAEVSSSGNRILEEYHKKIINEVASGFCGDITIKPMTEDDDGYFDKNKSSNSCVITIEFQGKDWVFTAPFGKLYMSGLVDGIEFKREGKSKIDIGVADMITAIATHSLRSWKRTRKLARLNEDRLTRLSAIHISKVTGACYHEHMLDISWLADGDRFDERDIAKFYSNEYEVYYPMIKLIQQVYKNINNERAIAKWREIDIAE